MKQDIQRPFGALLFLEGDVNFCKAPTDSKYLNAGGYIGPAQDGSLPIKTPSYSRNLGMDLANRWFEAVSSKAKLIVHRKRSLGRR